MHPIQLRMLKLLINVALPEDPDIKSCIVIDKAYYVSSLEELERLNYEIEMLETSTRVEITISFLQQPLTQIKFDHEGKVTNICVFYPTVQTTEEWKRVVNTLTSVSGEKMRVNFKRGEFIYTDNFGLMHPFYDGESIYNK